VKTFVVLPGGDPIRLTGPIEVFFVEDSEAKPIARRSLALSAKKGGGAAASVSGSSATVATVTDDYSVRVDIKS
jgi:hypothetical protein